ncbi:Wzz/FepE/Etk N-terminal domain-containing protein [Spirosoma soli]|uniref:Wzz/FepE/Etk N-terminal domain-containing protein n=1 Tax=Spirosoma soli TaxID=1770529 RepID=A0ABW5M2Q0_9BACT
MSVTEDRRKERLEEDEIEIRLSDIVQFLRDSRRLILLGALSGLVVGALYAFSKPDMYTAQVTVMPEIQTKGTAGLSSLGSLAGLAGLNLDNLSASDAIRPDLYPNVLQSVPFALNLLKQPVYSSEFKQEMTLGEFLNRMGNYGIIRKVENSFYNKRNSENNKDEWIDPKNFSQALQVTKEQDEYIKSVQESATAVYDKKSGILTITTTEPDPVVAATVARLSLEYLTDYITTYRTEKASKQVGFLVKQVGEAKTRYQAAEYALSNYRDRNRSLFLNTAKIDEQRLQADYLLAQTVYNDLSKQLEQAKIKVQEETPVFKTLEPPTVPLHKSGPKRTFIMLGFAVIGAFVTLIVLLVKLIKGRNFTHIA